jgi:hypothetical protein
MSRFLARFPAEISLRTFYTAAQKPNTPKQNAANGQQRVSL